MLQQNQNTKVVYENDLCSSQELCRFFQYGRYAIQDRGDPVRLLGHDESDHARDCQVQYFAAKAHDGDIRDLDMLGYNHLDKIVVGMVPKHVEVGTGKDGTVHDGHCVCETIKGIPAVVTSLTARAQTAKGNRERSGAEQTVVVHRRAAGYLAGDFHEHSVG